MGLDADDSEGILNLMVDFIANLHQPPPFDRIEDDPVARQPLFEHLDLEFQKPDMGIAARGPRLMKQHQQRRQPSGEHRSRLLHVDGKCRIGKGPTFWTTAGGMQGQASPQSLAARTS